MPQLDEAALRRPDFRGGVPIVLCDGQEWTFPLPTFGDFYPILGGDGKLALTPGSDLGADYDGLVDAFVATETFGDEHLALAALALWLLSRNYAIDAGHLRHLLRIRRPDAPDVEANRAMWSAIRDVALGSDPGPKGRTPDGSAQPSSPTD